MDLQPQISKLRAIFLYSIVAFFLFFEMAIQVSPSVMAPQLMHDLNIGTFGLGIMSGIYFYSYTAMQIPSGLLFDRYSPRIIITLSILVCAAGTLLFATAQNMYVGSLARLLMGSGSAFAFVSVLVVTADLFKSTYFATITGITQMLAALGAMSGQMPISALVSVMGWRHTLLVLSLVGFLLAITVWTLLKYKKNSILIKHLEPSMSIKRHLHHIITNPQSWYVALYSCLLWAPMSCFASLWGVPYLTKIHHYEPTSAAFICSFMWLGLAITSPLLGIISTSCKNKIIPLAVSAILGALAFGFLLHYDFSPLIVCLLLFLAGAACSGQALAFTVVKENNPNSAKATAIAFNNMAVVLSGAIFQPLIGKLIELAEVHGTSLYDIARFKEALGLVLFSYVIGFFIVIFFISEPVIDR